ncbi:MAG: phenylalanine--tRNA ligase subunit alpha [Calditrichaeota bacterium]|nr:phenylalanine--tRNA ligase subunit alpha [Calditrichota bacterium]
MSKFDFDSLRKELEEKGAAIKSLDEAQHIRNEFAGRKAMTAASGSISSIKEPAERKEYGKAFGAYKAFAVQFTDELLQQFERRAKQQSLDLTLPGSRFHSGSLHPLTQVQNEVIDVFRGMGFSVETGPEVESVFYNFDALNTPEWHPARDLSDTFYVDMKGEDRLNWVLRTETSPVQIRVMQTKKPPIRIIAPGRVYRSDKPDATHTPIFSQVEGLYVDEGVSFADLKGTVLAFYRAIFGSDIKTRFRPHFFPFTEPSAEVDMSCIFCGAKGCRVCKHSGWLEMGGSGMVDPKVLDVVGIDSEKYTGWAFGLGIERIAMLKFGVNDLRLFYENDVRFLSQF